MPSDRSCLLDLFAVGIEAQDFGDVDLAGNIDVVGQAGLLIDGFVQGRWRTEMKGKLATLVVEPFVNWNRKLQREVNEEGERLLDLSMQRRRNLRWG